MGGPPEKKVAIPPASSTRNTGLLCSLRLSQEELPIAHAAQGSPSSQDTAKEFCPGEVDSGSQQSSMGSESKRSPKDRVGADMPHPQD